MSIGAAARATDATDPARLAAAYTGCCSTRRASSPT